jgi:hypothetical protein
MAGSCIPVSITPPGWRWGAVAAPARDANTKIASAASALLPARRSRRAMSGLSVGQATAHNRGQLGAWARLRDPLTTRER